MICVISPLAVRCAQPQVYTTSTDTATRTHRTGLTGNRRTRTLCTRGAVFWLCIGRPHRRSVPVTHTTSGPLTTIQHLIRALERGNRSTPTPLTQGSALQVEPIDATLRSTTFDVSHLRPGSAATRRP